MVTSESKDVTPLQLATHKATVQALQWLSVDIHTGVSVLLTDDDTLHRLNLEYRGVDTPTDVLSFPSGDIPDGMPKMEDHAGDIAISIPTATRQASGHDHDLAAEIQLLVIHGILHLFGYDHETAEGRREMWAAQAAILAELGLENVVPTE